MDKPRKPLQAVIKLKLGACLTMRTKQASKRLQEIATSCDKARNAAMRHWERWREDNPTWEPTQRRDRKGQPKVTKDNKPILESKAYPQDLINSMYHVGRDAAKYVSSNLISACSVEVTNWLSNRTPYNHEGDAKYCWEAVLKNEISRPTFRARTIPMPSKNFTFRYGEDNCSLDMTLYSRESGQNKRVHTWRLEVSGLPAGKRKWLRRAASGEIDIRDSKLKFDRGAWYLLMVCDACRTAHKPDPNQVAELMPMTGKSRNPWELRFGEEDLLYLGDGVAVAAEFQRRLGRVRALGSKYRYNPGAGAGTGGPNPGHGRGHGRGRYYAKLKPLTRARNDFASRIRNQLVADIVRACVRNNCGTLQYREPSIGLRDTLWYAAKGIDFDWTAFLGHLRYVAARNNVLLDDGAPRMSRKEYVGAK